MFSVSFIIPCFNCEKFINGNIYRLLTKIKKLNVNYQIILINDGSSDKTSEEIKKIKSKYKKRFLIINLPINKGKSFAIRAGLKKTKFKNIVLLDADLPYFNYLGVLINKLKKNESLLIIDRNHPKSLIINKKLDFYQFSRKIIGKLISKMIFFYLGLNDRVIDTQAGLKGFKVFKNFNKINFISNKFFFDIELIYLFKVLKKEITTIPVRYSIDKKSTIKFFNIKNFKIIIDLIKVLIFLKSKNSKKIIK